MEKNKNFEEIAKDLEGGNLSLDESVKKFEEGMEISKSCSKILEDAEKKITILVQNSDEKIVEKDFDVV